MSRLNVERLEGRELMASNLAAGAAVPVAASDAGVTDQVVVSFTPPIGSNKGSFAGDGFGAVPFVSPKG
jgi:hypothetical protein